MCGVVSEGNGEREREKESGNWTNCPAHKSRKRTRGFTVHGIESNRDTTTRTTKGLQTVTRILLMCAAFIEEGH